MAKTRVLVLAGGQSDEHEVSIVSANSLLRAVSGTDLDATALVIGKDGRWLSPKDSIKALSDGAAKNGGDLTLHQAQVAEQYDIVFPIIHGPHGEDGTVQGMLELANIPYVGSGVLGSALCMDKVAFKDILRANDIPHVPGRLVTSHGWAKDRAGVLAQVKALRAPWFVKPANLGSSVGVSKAANEAELVRGIDAALKFGRRVIIEQGLNKPREIEIGIMGNDVPDTSSIGEITYASDWYDYETKYTAGRADLHIPAEIPAAVARKVEELAVRAYLAADCAGFARVDFFYDAASGDVLLNEINTIPGFTPMSMFTKLWEHKGVPYAQVVARLVQLGLERHRGAKRS